MTKAKKQNLSVEELLEQALIPEDDQPYEVPVNWVWTYTGHIIDIIMGQSPKGEDTTDNPKYTGLIGGAADMGELYPKVSRYTVKPTKLSKKDDVIVSIRATLGRPIFSDGEYCLGRGVSALRSNTILSYYIRCYVLNNEEYLYSVATGSTFAQVSKDDLERMPFPLPPLSEQQRIVDRIESLFAKLDQAKELAQNALDSFETRKASILHKAFTGELTTKWREEHGVGLDSWCTVSLGELIVNGPQNGLYKPQDAYGEGYMIVRIDSFYDGTINPWNTLKHLSLTDNDIEIYGLNNNDILVNRVNSMAYLGKSALVRDLTDVCVFESNIMRLAINEQVAKPIYIIRYLNSSNGLAELRKNAKQAVNQASINQSDVKNCRVPLPSLLEQNEIVSILDRILMKEEEAKKRIDIIEQIEFMKKAILARAFRGELGTNDPLEENAKDLLIEVLINSKEDTKEVSKIIKRGTSMKIDQAIESELKTNLEREIYIQLLKEKQAKINDLIFLSNNHFEITRALYRMEKINLIENRNGVYSCKRG